MPAPLTDSGPDLEPGAPSLTVDGVPRRRAVVACMWDGVALVGAVGPSEPDPEPETLTAVAEATAVWNGRDGGPASVRTIEVFGFTP